MKSLTLLKDKSFIKFLITFLGIYLLLYFTIKIITGLAIQGGGYNSFVEKYFNIALWMRNAIISSSALLLKSFGIATERIDDYVLRAVAGSGVRIVYACLGFAVMSFWSAYTIAVEAAFKTKLVWFCCGLLLLFFINVCRISLVLVANNKNWVLPFGLDHHTWFNIVSYIFIGLMIYFFEMNVKKQKNIAS